MNNNKQRLNHLLLAAAVALPLWTAASAVRSADMPGAHPPALEDGQPGGHGGPGADDGRASDANGPDHGHRGPVGPGGPDGFGGPGGFASFGPGPGGPFGGPGGPGFGGPPPMLRGVELTEAQQDKVFAILHAETPYLRDQAKAAAKAREALRVLAAADKYDDAKAASLAQAAAAADATIALQRVRTQQKLLAVLTAEQRARQAQGREQRREQDREQDRAGGKPHGLRP
ncbi:MAG: periplasmic heavy metal sensor [Duganella sp.]